MTKIVRTKQPGEAWTTTVEEGGGGTTPGIEDVLFEDNDAGGQSMFGLRELDAETINLQQTQNSTLITAFPIEGATAPVVQIGPVVGFQQYGLQIEGDGGGSIAAPDDDSAVVSISQGAGGTVKVDKDGVWLDTLSIGMYGRLPVAQGAPIANATNATNVITQLNLLLAYLRNRGDIDE